MEFGEKLKCLRKSKGLTQEELAEVLYVSRTAVSKWESGRGYPNIDSLREISKFFSVSVDEMLSGERLLDIAENENKSSIRNICDFLFGTVDLLAFILVLVPLYPNTIEGYVYSVNLIAYAETSAVNKVIHWVMVVALVLAGVLKLIFTKINAGRTNKAISEYSLIINVFLVLFLAVTREAYAVIVAFLILMIKVIIFLKYAKGK